MKRNRIWIIVTAACVITALVITVFVLVAGLPENHCKRILYSNASDFESLVDYVRQYGITGKTGIGDDDIPQEIEEILIRLNEKYQPDSDYPVFTMIDVKQDGDGDIYISVQAEKHKLKNGDGHDSPDIRCCQLVYVDPDYSDSFMEKNARPFYGNWRIWSSDMWSG